MTWLAWTGIAIALLIIVALLDLFVLTRGLAFLGPDADMFWIRPRSAWNLLVGHEGLSIGRTIHVRLRDPAEPVSAAFPSHEYRHLMQQAGKVAGIGAPPVAFVLHYLTDSEFVATVEADAVAFGAANASDAFWLRVAKHISDAQVS